MAKKPAYSDEQLEDLFKVVKDNNEEVVKVINSSPQAGALEVKKPVDKTTLKEYSKGKGFAIHKNKETKKFEILEIDYDTSTGEARIVNVLSSTTNELVASRLMAEATTRVLRNLSLESMRKRR